MEDNPRLNLADLLSRQRLERYRAVVVIGEAACGKSDYARSLAHQAGAHYLDLLSLFAARPDLAERVASTRPDALIGVVSEQVRQDTGGSGIALIDNADFLLDTWTERDRRDFGGRVLMLDDRQCPVVLCFFLQEDEALADLRTRDVRPPNHGGPRVIRFESLQALGAAAS